MSERREPGVIGSLPSTRPHRRSAKRAPASEPDTPAAEATRAPTAEPARTQASGRPRSGPPRTPSPAAEPEPAPGVLQTAVEAAVELTEIGLRIGAQALRTTLSRLPRP